MASILIVEDDLDIAAGLAEFLEDSGHQLDFAYNGRQAIDLLQQHGYDLVLLDLNLPRVDGLEVCQQLKASGPLASVPVIMMTARDKTEQVLAGFASGAWDYLIKPFSFAELLARINVVLAKQSAAQTRLISWHGVSLNTEALTVSYADTSIQLHTTGSEIMALLLEHAPNAVKSQTLCRRLWGEQVPESAPLRAHVYKLRKQLLDAFGVEMIQTAKGIGYRLDVE